MILDGDVYVNGQRAIEEYIPPEVRTNPGTFAKEGELITLGNGEYFVFGDNRNNSQDSRFLEYGPIKREWLKGRVILRYWPLSAFGIIGTGKVEFAN
jgi:signal peptidase I